MKNSRNHKNKHISKIDSKAFNGLIGAFALFVFITFIGLPSGYAEISFSVSPPIIELNVPGGGVKVMKLIVYNQGDVSIHVSSSVMDMEIDPDGNTALLPSGTSSWSCANWITLDNGELDLEAGEKKTVIAKLSVPRGKVGGRYAAIIFQAIGPQKKNSGEIVVGARLGTLILETIPHTLKKRGKIVKIETRREPKDNSQQGAKTPITIVASFKNRGNAHVKASGSVVIWDSNKKIVDRIPLIAGTGTVLPDGTRKFKGTWSNKKKMVEGEYTAQVRITFPGGREQASTKIVLGATTEDTK
ncbi:MAG: hypothetical protein HON76_10540 [Candidatus Scalindua sp.]|jgi:hypothetical protein|nr:hypothetical protein [Candidatus Scalindua sp.]MBT5304029.1 hypothetical protein [Candidatus Scalindua sp.]MBT6047842.1 hypothetical protein [Candidatus Scalindua sp.]MBT6228017.1 hypothetical protein [Candidatus Scalindua sp.]MBT6562951.1 hypothetical protein [Candidatus Scalindua sp.]